LPDLVNRRLEYVVQRSRIRRGDGAAGSRLRFLHDVLEKAIELCFVHDVKQSDRQFQLLQFVKQTCARFAVDFRRRSDSNSI
jgi:hypothetical protein